MSFMIHNAQTGYLCIMKKNIFLSMAAALLLTPTIAGAQETVTLQSLLREMVDRKEITQFPDQVPFRTLQASSYNRASVSPDQPGWFADADGVFCIRTEKNKRGETEWVLMEDDGPGAITKIWAVCFYYGLNNTTGANINIYLDGADEPTIHCNFFDFVKGKVFVKPPLASETTRAGDTYLPIPYAKGCKITMDKKVFYNIINYRSYAAGTKVKTFTLADLNQSKALVDSVNHVLSLGAYSALSALPKKRIYHLDQTVAPKAQQTLHIKKSGSAIEQLSFKIDAKDIKQALRSTVLKITFDGEQTVWTPLGDFFNIGVGVKEYKMWERAVQADGTMTCRWIMPFKKVADIELENLGNQEVAVEVEAITGKYQWTDRSMYFHSNWRIDEPTPCFPLFDYNLVEVKGQGVYVGDQFTVLNPSEGWWGEGDEKVYVDDDKFPSHFGTGTEDYYGWAGGVFPTPKDEFALPFLSNVRVGSPNAMGYNTCTRTRALDAIPFKDYLNFNIEASCGTRTSWFHLQYSLNTYWYAKPGATHNRKPLPEMAARKIMALEELQALNAKAKASKYVVADAIEAENLATYAQGEGTKAIPTVKVWGDLSNNDAKCFQMEKAGSEVKVRLTEIFSATPLKVCLINDNQGTKTKIYVNDTFIREVNLKSEHSGVVVIDLGKQTPKNNAYEVKFVTDASCRLGVDYFLIK